MASLLQRSARYKRAMEGNPIRDERGHMIPMRFSDSQDIMWRYVAPELDVHGKLWFIVLKARQTYATTFFQNLAFVRTTEQANTKSLIIAQDLYTAQDIFTKAKTFYENLPLPKLPPKAKEIIFNMPAGRSTFNVISAGKASKGRGTNQTCLHCSEFAFWPHAEVATGLFQAMPDLPDTMWVIESTANGMIGIGQPFYDQWRAAVRGQSGLIPIFIPWFIMPKYRADAAIHSGEWDAEEELLVSKFGKYGLDGHSLAWRRSAIVTKCQGSLELFHQEYPSTAAEAFISSGLPAFDPLAVLKQQGNIRRPIFRGTMTNGKLRRLPKGELQIWKEPEDGHVYFVGVDTSEALRGGDFACAQIVDMTDLEQVAVVHGMIQPWDMASLLAQLGDYYNKAMINIELKNTGHAVQDYLIRIHMYPFLHPWRGKADHVRYRTAKLYGWDTNVFSRPLLIEAGRRAIDRALLTIHDEATIEEIQQFSRQDNGKYEASAGHDDRVLALLLALRSGEENYHQLRPNYWGPDISEPDMRGIRVIDASEPDKMGLRRIHRLLQGKAEKAVKSWLEL